MDVVEFLHTQPKYKAKEYDFNDNMPMGMFQGLTVREVVEGCPECIVYHYRHKSIPFTKAVRAKANKLYRLKCTAKFINRLFEESREAHLKDLDDIEEFHFNGKDW